MRQLTSADVIMLAADTPRAQNVIGPIGIYDPSTGPAGNIGFDDVLAFVKSRLHVSTIFRERLLTVPLSVDRPYWIDDDSFDLEYHVRHLALPAPGDWRQFCTQIARIGARPLDMNRPPWELYVIEGLNDVPGVPEGSFATFLRMHHAAVDGVAGSEILTALHDLEPNADRRAPDRRWQPDPVPSSAELLGRAVINGFQQPIEVIKTALPAVRFVANAVRDARDPARASAAGLVAATRFNNEVGPHRVWGSAMTTLDVMKRIRAGVPEAKVNDIALAIVGGGLRTYLLDKDELPRESLVALMPISVRPTQAHLAKVGQAPPIESESGGNSFAMSTVSMSTDLVDPLDRVRRIRESTSYIKELGAQSAGSLVDLAQVLPGSLAGTVQRALVRTINRTGRALGVHTIVTNVPGAQMPMYFCGAQMVTATGMAPIADGMGLVNAVGSYNGRVPICFTSDRDMMPDPEFYEKCIYDSVDELLERAEGQTPTRRTQRGRAKRSAAGASTPRNRP